MFTSQSSFPSIQGKISKKSHCFPPMNRDHRRIIHDLAQVYGLESVSYDSEPKRNVVVTAVRCVDLAVTGETARGGPGPENLGWSVTSAGGLHWSLVPPWAWPWAAVFLPSLEDEVKSLPLGQLF